jgi:hypothetical protein
MGPMGVAGPAGPQGPPGSGSGASLGPGWVNVRDAPYSAKGDGATDDTAAIQHALDDVGALGGGVVFVPTGNYAIATHLSVPAYTALTGVFRAPQAYAQNKGTTLLASEGAGSAGGAAFITLAGNGSTVDGVVVFYPGQVLANPPTAYPWTIRAGGGDNATILNTLLVNPYNGVDFATNPSGRHFIRGLYGQPLNVGISVDQCYDIGRIQDVHFWPFWTQDANVIAYQNDSAFTFVFARTDWEVVEDVFSWGYHVGALFQASSKGAMNGQMSNVNFDNVDSGLDCYDTQPFAVHISNLNIANAGGGSSHIGIWNHATGTSCNLAVHNASFWGSIEQAVLWQKGGLFSMSDARVLAWDGAKPAIDIAAGRAMIHDSFFQDVTGTAVHVGAGADRVMITNNELAGNTLSIQNALTLAANNHP